MKCENCGANVPENVTECSFCGTNVTEAAKKGDSHAQVQTQNPLLGKEYSFVSTYGTRLFSLSYGMIRNKITVSSDRLFIETRPKKCNIAPAVLFEDITGINISTSFSVYSIIAAIAFLISGICGGVVFLLGIPFVLWALSNKKITIYQRNGKNIIIYSRSKAAAVEFKSDMKMVAEIQ